jgi:hypothetical protein
MIAEGGSLYTCRKQVGRESTVVEAAHDLPLIRLGYRSLKGRIGVKVMRQPCSINQTIDGETLLSRSRSGQLELWKTAGGLYGTYLWVLRPGAREDDKLCIMRKTLPAAQDLFDTVAIQLGV